MLCWLKIQKELHDYLARWIMNLQEYKYEVIFKTSKMLFKPDCPGLHSPWMMPMAMVITMLLFQLMVDMNMSVKQNADPHLRALCNELQGNQVAKQYWHHSVVQGVLH